MQQRLFSTASSVRAVTASVPRFVLYTGSRCSLCEEAKELLDSIPETEADFELDVVDISTDQRWRRLYQYDIPVLKLDTDMVAKGRIEKSQVLRAIQQWQAAQQSQQM